MTQTQHTEGPWTVKPNGIGVYAPNHHLKFADICEVYGFGNANMEQQQANARLIAAAPQLLEALKFMENRGVWDVDCQAPGDTSTHLPAYMNPAVRKARAAIKAATEMED